MTLPPQKGRFAPAREAATYPCAIILPYRRPSTRQLQHIGAPLDALESSLDGHPLTILRRLRQRALQRPPAVYLVGGPVRDLLMGMPAKDLDFVVEGDGFEVAGWLAEEVGGRVRRHPRFGTSTVFKDRDRVDFATARRETYPRPAVLPEVSPGAIGDDLARRDFSINAMAVPLGELRPGVMDLHGGLEDLRCGLLRVLHPESFADDPTRVFRAVRYEQRLGLRMEAGTRRLLDDAVARGHVTALSAARLRHELERFLEEERPVLALKRAAVLGVMSLVHPSWGDREAVARLDAVASWGRDGTPHTGAGPLVLIAALSYRLSPPEAEAVISRLSLTKDWAQVVRDVVLLVAREAELASDGLPESRIAGAVGNLRIEAVAAVCRLTNSPPVALRLERYLTGLRFLKPALSGDDLLAMGVPQGPALGHLLGRLRDAKLDGIVATEDDERGLVRRLLNQQEGPGGHG